jgi:hypothetical protein
MHHIRLTLSLLWPQHLSPQKTQSHHCLGYQRWVISTSDKPFHWCGYHIYHRGELSQPRQTVSLLWPSHFVQRWVLKHQTNLIAVATTFIPEESYQLIRQTFSLLWPSHLVQRWVLITSDKPHWCGYHIYPRSELLTLQTTIMIDVATTLITEVSYQPIR